MPPWEKTASVERLCQTCSASFYAKRDNAKYCSARCQERARRPRKYEPEKRKEWRERRLEQAGYRERVNEQAKQRSYKIKRFVRRVKLMYGCHDCGYKEHHAALEFDHIGSNKELNVAFANSIGQAKREIRKCVVRCANCHRTRHFQDSSTGS